MMNKYRELINTPDFLPYDPKHECFYDRSINLFLAPKGCGKSTYLQFLKLYYDKKEDASDLFVDNTFHMNQHMVIYLDFSDFNAKSYEEALRYFALKMSELYLLYLKKDRKIYPDFYIDALEGKASEEILVKAIDHINFDHDQPYDKPLILIDDITLPLAWSIKHGYYEQMNTLLFKMIDVDVYERNHAIVLTGDIPNGKGIPFPLPHWIYAMGPSVLPHTSELYRRNTGEELIVLPHYDPPSTPVNDDETIDALIHDTEPYGYSISEKLLAKTKQMRIDWNNHLAEEERKRIEEDLRTRKEHAYILPYDCLRLSPHCGAHGYPIGNDPQHLNDLLRDIYRNVDYTKHLKIYDYVFQVNQDIITDYRKINTHDLHISPSRYYLELDHSRKHYYGRYKWIKIYISLKDRVHIASFINDSMDYLLANAKESFHIMAAKTARMHNAIYWVDRKDFFAFEEFLNQYQDLLEDSLPFHAHRGKLGITKEYFCHSHNYVFSVMISHYLQRVTSQEEISFTAMMDTFVKAWTMELENDDNSYRYSSYPVIDVIHPLGDS